MDKENKKLPGDKTNSAAPKKVGAPKSKKTADAKSAKKPAKTSKKDIKPQAPEVRRVAMSKESLREKGSITPPGIHLVDAFSRLKTSRTQREAPAVTRLPAGGIQTPKAAPKPPIAATKPAQAAPSAAASAPAAPPPKQISPARPAAVAPPAAKPSPPVKQSPARPAPATPAKPQVQTPPATPKTAAPAPTRPKSTPPSATVHSKGAVPAATEHALKTFKVSTQITVRELAEKMEVKVNDVIKKLMSMGVFATINQRLEPEAASLAAHDFGFEIQIAPMEMEEELALKAAVDKPEQLKPRPPVVTIMGHVDHGKTSLLDAIRSARVAEREAGGITQHIGAYQVRIPKGEITFLDTPGHEAFTAMRARGAKVTDVVVLVVSAADGVMPQTVEAIDHAKAAGVSIVVAVNKIDLPTAQPQKIRQELTAHGLQPEEWGGKTIFVDVSAKKRLHLDKLLEMLLLQSEVMELKANPDRPGIGIILEARLDPRRGPLATLLVQNGTVKVGQSFVAGLSYGKVKALVNDKSERILLAGPSTPVELLGISGELPQAGDTFNIVQGERQAREIAEKRRLIHREEAFAHKKHVSLVGLKSEIEKGAKDLNIILKADVQGSVQAIQDLLGKLTTPEISIRMLHAGVGNASESDVLLAGASNAIIVLFHVGIEPRAQEVADRAGVEVRRYEIIYEIQADVKAAMEGLLEPEIVEIVSGRAEVRQVFSTRAAKVAGCYIREGKIARGGTVRLTRAGQVVGEAKVESLKRFKDDVSEVEKGLECGIVLSFKDFQVGDLVELVVKEKHTRRLESAS
ncbi:MAG: translation initiation factor IF-2 [Elusimicrobia bacterium]|nr:translation initiation factor IF-2 [Elusimicrobiota bacterium]